MACNCPMSGWYAQKVNPSGKRSIVFNPSKAFVDMPVQIPCGKCTGCRADQALMWSIRAYHEASQHERNCFVTLTYCDNNYPADGKISKRELQLFFKRLRKKTAPVKLRYIACGEYGTQSGRAHYHAVIFGLDFLGDQVPINQQLYTSPTLEECWGKGQVSIAPVTMSSICYTCGYVLKKLDDQDTFSLASRRPWIGNGWLEKYQQDIINTGKIIIEGREYPVPQRYLSAKPEELCQVKKDRKRYALAQSKKFDPVETRKRLDARQVNRKALLNQKVEKL